MKPDAKDIHWVKEPELGLAGKSYLPLIVGGVTTTLKHLVGRKSTVQAPEERHEMADPVGYRGVHRLNRDEHGRVKCVACFLCSTACPAHCIDIIAAESPWPDREKYPQSFSIDELRCIFCGMCEEACPVDAIELTSLYDLSGKSREEMIFDKEKLLSVYDQTKDTEPMRSVRGAGRHGEIILNQSLETIVPAVVLGALGMWLLLPRPSLRGRMAGAIMAAVALGLIASRMPALGGITAQGVFYVLAGVTVISAAATVSLANPIYCAIWFAMTLLGTAGLFLLQGAQFLAVATVVVYAGAILVTFLFVLMLAEPSGSAYCDRLSWEGMLSAVGGVVLIGILTAAIGSIMAAEASSPLSTPPVAADLAAGVLNENHVMMLGREMFGPQWIAVQAGGVLLLAALIGAAAIVAGGKLAEPRDTFPGGNPKAKSPNQEEGTMHTAPE